MGASFGTAQISLHTYVLDETTVTTCSEKTSERLAYRQRQWVVYFDMQLGLGSESMLWVALLPDMGPLEVPK